MSDSLSNNLTKVATYTGLLADAIALVSAAYALLSYFEIVPKISFDAETIRIPGYLTVKVQSVILLITIYGAIALGYAFRSRFAVSARRSNKGQSAARTLRFASASFAFITFIPLFVLGILFEVASASQLLAFAILLVILVVALAVRWQPGPIETAHFNDVGLRYFFALPLIWFLIQLDPKIDWPQALYQSITITSAAYLFHLLIAWLLRLFFRAVRKGRRIPLVTIKLSFGGLVAIIALVALAFGVQGWNSMS